MTRLESLQQRNLICFRMSLIIYRGLLMKLGVRVRR